MDRYIKAKLSENKGEMNHSERAWQPGSKVTEGLGKVSASVCSPQLISQVGEGIAAENPLVRLATLQQRQINLTSPFDAKQTVII